MNIYFGFDSDEPDDELVGACGPEDAEEAEAALDAEIARDEAQPARRTRAELDKLKHQWQLDPVWDIEDTEGFEAYRDELAQYHAYMEKHWSDRRLQRLEERAVKLGVPGNIALAEYVERLERRLENLTERLYALEGEE